MVVWLPKTWQRMRWLLKRAQRLVHEELRGWHTQLSKLNGTLSHGVKSLSARSGLDQLLLSVHFQLQLTSMPVLCELVMQ